MAALPTALEVSSLSKSYRIGHIRRRLRPVLTDLTFDVRRGEIFGYLGPNGSGKTTTLKVLTGLLRPDAGTVRILDLPLEDRAWRYRVGYLPEHPYLYDYLTATEYLDYVGRLFGLSSAVRKDRARDLLARVNLSRSAHLSLRRFSKGMVQRVGIAQALMNDPEFVILDEPMSGLDPLGRRLVRNLILGLKAAGKTVFFSTHILSDAETLCDRVAVLREGRLLDVGPLAEILRLDVSHMEVLVSGIDGSALELAGLRARQPLGERWRLEIDERALGALVGAVEARGGRVLSVQPIRQSLEDYFFKELGNEPSGGPWGGGRLNRVLAVAANTFRETIRERVLYNLVFFAILMTLSGLLLDQLSIRQDEKLIKDIGLASMELFGTLIAIFIGVGLVSKEIERRSLYPLLAKPLTRDEFFLGKFAGLAFTLLLNVAVMAAGVFLTLLATGSAADFHLLSAAYPIYLGLLLVVSLAMLFSSLTSSALAAVLTVGMVIGGRYADVIKNMREVAPDVPSWFVDGLYYLLPNFRNFDFKDRVAYGDPVPLEALGWVTLYGVLYVTLVLGAGLLSFRSRDFQ